MRNVLAIVFLALIVSSCSDDDPETPPIEFRLTVGDTLIIIPEEAVLFAGGRGDFGNFTYDAYMLREYQVATDEDLPHPGATFSGTLNDWKALGWDLRQTFLLPPYTRDIKTNDGAQYYYMIGTYLDQFGYGWRDTFDPEANLFDPAVHIWLHPADTTLIPDAPGTIGFDGTCQLVSQYRTMWRFE